MNYSEIIILTAQWRGSRAVMGRLWTTVEPDLPPACLYGYLVIVDTLLWSDQKLSQSYSNLKNPFHTTTPFMIWPINVVPL